MKTEQQERDEETRKCVEGLGNSLKRILLYKSKDAKSKNSKRDLNQSRKGLFEYHDFESLILAQDERWRRA